MFFLFAIVIAGPLIMKTLKISLPDIPLQLLQPSGLNNNDTSSSHTGKAATGGAGAQNTEAAKLLRF